MNAFLDKFCKTHRLHTFQAAKRWAETRNGSRPMKEGPGNPLPMEDTLYILRHGKKAWKRLKGCSPDFG